MSHGHLPLQIQATLTHSIILEFVTVNAVINCAGIGIARKTLSKSRDPDTDGQLIPHSLHDFTKALTINTIGTFNVARLAAQRMASRKADSDGIRGCIINTASIAAFDGQRGQVAYATSKAAIVGMTLPMARDLASVGIRVMAIVSCIIAQTDCATFKAQCLFFKHNALSFRHSRLQVCLKRPYWKTFPTTSRKNWEKLFPSRRDLGARMSMVTWCKRYC
jgi:NAD(P)-dependent dehydrogenase (short-subunit alcohol dehydrogenase family)